MRLLNYEQNEFKKELLRRISEIEQRERIIIVFPFSCSVNRVEIYCSETATNFNAMGEIISGEKFNGVITYSVFKEIGSNKADSKSSYSYKREFIDFIENIIPKFYELIKK